MKSKFLGVLIGLSVPLLATAVFGVAASSNPIPIAGKRVSCNWSDWSFDHGTVQALTTSGCIERNYLHVGPFQLWD